MCLQVSQEPVRATENPQATFLYEALPQVSDIAQINLSAPTSLLQRPITFSQALSPAMPALTHKISLTHQHPGIAALSGIARLQRFLARDPGGGMVAVVPGAVRGGPDGHRNGGGVSAAVSCGSGIAGLMRVAAVECPAIQWSCIGVDGAQPGSRTEVAQVGNIFRL